MISIRATCQLLPEAVRQPLRSLFSIIPLEWRMGKKYWELRRFLEQAQWWKKERIEAWQLEKLKLIVTHAYDNVPGYRTLFLEAGVKPADIRSLNDMQSLPFTSKALLRDNLKEFTAVNIPKLELRFATTGGSTGTPFGFYKTAFDNVVEDAFMHAGWERVGWQLGLASAVLRGGYTGSEDKISSYNRLYRLLDLSSYCLNERTCHQYFEKIVQFAPPYLQAYPSAASLLGDYVVQHNRIGEVDFDLILLGSENIYEWQKNKLRAAFPRSKLFGWYGHTERVILAPWCENSEEYHDWPFYGVTEILKNDGCSAKVGERGELVGTSLWSLATPFIRYHTDDFVVAGQGACDKCGRNFRLIEKVEGRRQDFVVTRDGTYVTLTALIFAQHFHAFGVIKNMQLYQDKPGKVLVRVIPTAEFTAADSQEIKQTMESAVNGRLEVSISLVDQIPITKMGKYRFLEQKLQILYGDQKT